MAGQNDVGDEFDDEGTESSGMKDLRKQRDSFKKERDELQRKLDEALKSSKERTVNDVLAAKGVRKGIAKFVPSDLESEDDITKWLEDNAEDLGITLSDSSGEESDEDTRDVTRARELSSRAKAPGATQSHEDAINSAATPEALSAAIEAARQALL